MTRFYERAVGLQLLSSGKDHAELGSPDGTVLVELHGDARAPDPPRGSSGLYHLALLVADRSELARALHRVQDAGWRFTGSADHLVSEALYLQDPEDNGIEIYRDRPREQWRRGPTGELEMATLALDVEGILAELPGGALPPAVDAASRIGHVHLHVHDLAAAEAFYTGEVGLDVVVRSYPGALFLSHGGYHHHIGLNTWSGAAGPPPPGSRGLRQFRIGSGGATLRDPSGNAVEIDSAR